MFGVISNFVEISYAEISNSINFNYDKIIVGDKEITESRGTYWFSDFDYTFQYGSKTMIPQKMHPVIKLIQQEININYGYYFDSVLANFYSDGNVSMRFHSDPTYDFWDEHSVVISLGAPRSITFRKTDNYEIRNKFNLNHGDLMFMKNGCQSTYQHRVDKSKNDQPRISLVFKRKL